MESKLNLGKKIIFNKKFFLALIPIIIILSAASFFIVSQLKNQTDNRVIATVNGEEIPYKEFDRIMRENREYIHVYFQRKYNVDWKKEKDFWTTKYGNEVPIEVNRKKSIDDAIRFKIQEILCKQQGLVDNISYSAFLQGLKKENEYRKKAVENKQAIYGSTELNESEYFTYYYGRLFTQLKTDLIEQKVNISDGELKKRYEAMKDSFTKQDKYNIDRISVSFGRYSDSNFKQKKERAQVLADQLAKRAANGEALKDIVNSVSDTDLGGLKIIYRHQTLNDTNIKTEISETDPARMLIEQYKEGQVSSAILLDDSYDVFKILKRQAQGYQAFADVKETIRSIYINEKYNELIDKNIKEAKVIIDNDMLNKSMVEEIVYSQ